MLRAVIIAGLALATPGLASTWDIDGAHTSAGFAVRHLMVSTVRGAFGKVSGAVTFDEQDPAKSSVEATIDVASVDTRNEKRDQHLKSADFLDVEKYPTIVFKSKKVTAGDKDHWRVTGDLTLHGVTKEVVLDVEGSPKPMKDPRGNLKLGGVATTKINRKDFGVVWNSPLEGGGVAVGDELDITIDVEIVKKAPEA
jgi:polyisoprenoid-binding protein YceI